VANITELKGKLARWQDRHEAAIMTAVAAGGIWTQARRAQAGFASSPLCPRCQREAESLYHLVWGCPANLASGHRWVQSTNHLRHRARDEWQGNPGRWLRGLVPIRGLPQKVLDLPTDLPEIIVPVVGWQGEGGREEVRPRRLLAASDGSGGGRRPKVGSMARTGAAWAVFGDDLLVLEAGMGRPPGKQTVPRAELWAAAEAIKASRHIETSIVIDASYVVKGMANIESVAEPLVAGRANGDLWVQLRAAVAARTAPLHVHKVKSHPTVDVIMDPKYSELPQAAWAANAYVDALAGTAAKEVEPVDEKLLAEVEELFDEAWSILLRVTAIVKERPDSRQQEQLDQEQAAADGQARQRPTLGSMLAASSHRPWAIGGGRMWCRGCRQLSPPAMEGQTAAAARRFRNWLSSQCSPTARSAHSSHSLCTGLTGWVGCRLCGKWGRERLVRLTRCCRGQAEGPADCLAVRRIRRGADPELRQAAG